MGCVSVTHLRLTKSNSRFFELTLKRNHPPQFALIANIKGNKSQKSEQIGVRFRMCTSSSIRRLGLLVFINSDSKFKSRTLNAGQDSYQKKKKI